MGPQQQASGPTWLSPEADVLSGVSSPHKVLEEVGGQEESQPRHYRLFHAPTRTTSSGCFMLHRTVHALWNLYGNPYRNRAETEEETIP